MSHRRAVFFQNMHRRWRGSAINLPNNAFLFLLFYVIGNILGTVLMIALSERTLSLYPAIERIGEFVQYGLTDMEPRRYIRYLLENRLTLLAAAVVFLNSKFAKPFCGVCGLGFGLLLSSACILSVMIWRVTGILVVLCLCLPHLACYAAALYMLMLASEPEGRLNQEGAGLAKIIPYAAVALVWILGMVCESLLTPRLLGWALNAMGG